MDHVSTIEKDDHLELALGRCSLWRGLVAALLAAQIGLFLKFIEYEKMVRLDKLSHWMVDLSAQRFPKTSSFPKIDLTIS